MSTNFYIYDNVCEHCGRKDEQHIGKRSCGWKFNFQWYPHLTSLAEYKEFLKDKQIFDEYGSFYTYEEFWHAIENHPGDKVHEDEFTYIESGYMFTKGIWS